MIKADASEVALLLIGAAGLAIFIMREYRSMVVVSHNSAFADSPRETIRRATVLALKVWVANRFISVDRAAVDDYRRFEKLIRLMVALLAANMLLVSVSLVGLVMLVRQTDFESQIRGVDLALITGYGITFLLGNATVDRLLDVVTDRKSSSSLIGRLREQSSKKAVRPLHSNEGNMRKPSPEPMVQTEGASLIPPSKVIYPALSAAEQEALTKDPEAVKRNLIAAGILDEGGEIKVVYKRE